MKNEMLLYTEEVQNLLKDLKKAGIEYDECEDDEKKEELSEKLSSIASDIEDNILESNREKFPFLRIQVSDTGLMEHESLAFAVYIDTAERIVQNDINSEHCDYFIEIENCDDVELTEADYD